MFKRSDNGGAGILVDYITNIKGDPRLYGILALGFISSFKKDLAWKVIEAKAISQLADALQNEVSPQLKAAACYALGHIGRHSIKHSKEVSNSNVLSLMLYYYKDVKSTDYLKEKSKQSMKKIIDNCANLSALEPLLYVAPDNILKHILNQYVKYLKTNNHELKDFVQNGGLQKLEEIRFGEMVKKSHLNSILIHLINTINSYYPSEIVKYYSPEGANEDDLPKEANVEDIMNDSINDENKQEEEKKDDEGEE